MLCEKDLRVAPSRLIVNIKPPFLCNFNFTDSRNQSSTASTTPTETTTSNSLSSSEINKTTLNKQQTPTDPPVYNLTSDITKHQPSTSPLFIATGPSEKTKLRSNTSNTSPMIPVTNKSTWKISSPTAMKLSTPSSIKQSSHSSVTFIPTSASLSEVDDDSGLNLMTTNSREKTQPTTSPELYKELDICSQNSLEFEEKMSLTSPGFSNGLNYPLNIACNKTVKGVIGEVGIRTHEKLWHRIMFPVFSCNKFPS